MRATVHTTTDRIEAHALCALLQSEGIDAQLAGVVDAARVGVGEGALPIHIEVPSEDEARAREVLATPPPPSEPSEDRPRLKKPVIAMGISVVWPGLGHVYAGRPYTGLLLGLGVIVSIIAAGGGRSSLGAAYIVLAIADAVFARRAVLALNAGRRRGVGGQLLSGLALVTGSFLLAGSAPLLAQLQKARRESELARVIVSCPRGRVVATNIGDAPRDIELTALVAVRQQLMAEDVEGVEWGGVHRGVLEPGRTLELWVGPEAPAVIAPLVQFRSQRELRMDVIVRRFAGDEGVRGTAYCTPGG